MVTANSYGLLKSYSKLLTLRYLYAFPVSLYIQSIASEDISVVTTNSYGLL